MKIRCLEYNVSKDYLCIPEAARLGGKTESTRQSNFNQFSDRVYEKSDAFYEGVSKERKTALDLKV